MPNVIATKSFRLGRSVAADRKICGVARRKAGGGWLNALSHPFGLEPHWRLSRTQPQPNRFDVAGRAATSQSRCVSNAKSADQGRKERELIECLGRVPSNPARRTWQHAWRRERNFHHFVAEPLTASDELARISKRRERRATDSGKKRLRLLNEAA